MVRALLLSMLFGCALDVASGPTAPGSADPTAAAGDMQCAGSPDAGDATDWRHLRSALVAGLGDPHHRGIDLIATTDDVTQVIGGKVAYSDIDKDLEDERVTVFACIDSTWTNIGSALTDDDGRFTLTLTGDGRLAAGMRDLYLSVDGDHTGAELIAFVAPPGAPVIVSDVDGTLTASENEYPLALASGGVADAQPDAATALTAAARAGATIIYVSTRGDRFTQDTRDWFATQGFPRGPMRLPTSIITIPGEDTVEAKTEMFTPIAQMFDLVAGIGNRATDVEAYTNVGVSPDRIRIKLPEFSDELADALDGGKAIGFDQYAALEMPVAP